MEKIFFEKKSQRLLPKRDHVFFGVILKSLPCPLPCFHCADGGKIFFHIDSLKLTFFFLYEKPSFFPFSIYKLAKKKCFLLVKLYFINLIYFILLLFIIIINIYQIKNNKINKNKNCSKGQKVNKKLRI